MNCFFLKKQKDMLGKIKQALMKNHDPARVNDNCLVNDITILICEGGHIVLKNPVLIQAVWHIGGHFWVQENWHPKN